MTTWSAIVGEHERRGEAADQLTAWRLAVDGALEIADETGGAEEPIELAVDGETADLFPALDRGELDQAATREIWHQLVSQLEQELDTPDAPPH